MAAQRWFVVLGPDLVTMHKSHEQAQDSAIRWNGSTSSPRKLLSGDVELVMQYETESDYEYHERLMVHHTEQCLALQPDRPLAALSTNDVRVRNVIRAAKALRGYIKATIPTQGRDLIEALNAYDDVRGCSRCGFTNGHSRHCNGPRGCVCCKRDPAHDPVDYYGEIHCKSCADLREAHS